MNSADDPRAADARALGGRAGVFRQLADGFPEPVAIRDVEGRYRYVNTAWCHAFGVRRSTALGRADHEIFPAAIAGPMRDGDLQVLVEQRPHSAEQVLLLGGLRREWAVTRLPIRDAVGRVTGVAATMRDLTTLRRVDQRLRQLSRAVEQSPVSVVITDAGGRIEYVNPRFVAMTGWSPDELRGTDHSHLVSTGATAEEAREPWETVRGGHAWRGIWSCRRKAGEPLPESAVGAPIRDVSGDITHFVYVSEDLTERQRAELLLAETQRQLHQAQKMEAVGRLAGGIAHDFNNLLTAILGYSQLASANLPAGSPERADLHQVVTAAQRASALVRQLLAYSRKQVLEPRVIEINEVLLELDKLLRHSIGEDIELRTLLHDGPTTVEVDPIQIEQVLVNLAINARDAMPGGGSLTIVTTLRDARDLGAPSASGATPARFVRITVADTGTGMSPEVRERIFEPFFTTKPTGKGSGLGLSTAYGIVKQSGGFIEVESEPGRGATFHVDLPAVDRPATAPAAARPVPALSGRETILVVEDDEAVRNLVERVLTQAGFRVLSAANAGEAILLFERHHAAIDLLLADLVLPIMMGRELAERLVTARPTLRVLYISGYSTESVRGGLSKTDFPFIAKPMNPEQLVGKVRRVLDDPRPQAGDD